MTKQSSEHRECIPRLIALEVTRNCPLNCIHCRAGETNVPDNNELHYNEVKEILDNIASFSNPIIILTGGEPLSRKDIFNISAYGVSQGLNMVLATCGYNVTEETIFKLKESGTSRLSFSIDGSTAETHNKFRGQSNSFENVIRAINLSRKHNLPFQINTTLTKNNVDKIDDIIDMAINLGAVSFHPFFLVPTGRAKNLRGLEMDAQEYEKALIHIYKISRKIPMEIKPTCAPQYHRIAGIKHRGCLAGTGFAFISHTGKVQTCGFLDVECGDLRSKDYRFEKIWRESKTINKLRHRTNYQGKCACCDYYNSCGGCRARAYEINGSYLAEEPYCLYEASDG